MIDHIKEFMNKEFAEYYGDYNNTTLYFAPGRVNLIGEHTDYNGGHVFPCAITLGTYCLARKRTDRKIRMVSVNFKEEGMTEISLDELQPQSRWSDYPSGIAWAFAQHGYQIDCGLELLIYGDIPSGSGLSSSASLEVVTGIMLNDLFQLGMDKIEIAKFGQYSENQFNHCNCGILDQFSSAMGRKDHAMFLDTNTLQYEYVPITLNHAKIVITNSMVKHNLAESGYNTRRSECEKALAEFQQILSIRALGKMDEETFEQNKQILSSETLMRRAKHAVYENQRTIQAKKALNQGNIKLFGELMNQSHISLRDDYEVSCTEIDFLVSEAWKIPGVVGSRITGGGFGGCTVSIIEEDAIESYQQMITDKYSKHIGIAPEFYIVEVGNGAIIM